MSAQFSSRAESNFSEERLSLLSERSENPLFIRDIRSAGYDTALTGSLIDAMVTRVRADGQVLLCCDERSLDRIYPLITEALGTFERIEGLKASFYLGSDGDGRLRDRVDYLLQKGSQVVLVGYPTPVEPSAEMMALRGASTMSLLPFTNRGTALDCTSLTDLVAPAETWKDGPQQYRVPTITPFDDLLTAAQESGTALEKQLVLNWWQSVAGEDAIPVLVYTQKLTSELGAAGWDLRLDEILRVVETQNKGLTEEGSKVRYVPLLTQFVPPQPGAQEKFESGVSAAISQAHFSGRVVLFRDRTVWAGNFGTQDMLVNSLNGLGGVAITPANTFAHQLKVLGWERAIIVTDLTSPRERPYGSGGIWDLRLLQSYEGDDFRIIGRNDNVYELFAQQLRAAAPQTVEQLTQQPSADPYGIWKMRLENLLHRTRVLTCQSNG